MKKVIILAALLSFPVLTIQSLVSSSSEAFTLFEQLSNTVNGIAQKLISMKILNPKDYANIVKKASQAESRTSTPQEISALVIKISNQVGTIAEELVKRGIISAQDCTINCSNLISGSSTIGKKEFTFLQKNKKESIALVVLLLTGWLYKKGYFTNSKEESIA